MEKAFLGLIGKFSLFLSLVSITLESKTEFSVIDALTTQYLSISEPSDSQHYYNSDNNNIHGNRVKREIIRFGQDIVLIPENYSIHEPPPIYNGKPTKAEFYILIIDIRDINEVQEEMTLEMNLQIYWKDARLGHWSKANRTYTKNDFGVLNPSLIKDIWHPDIFIDHVKKIDQPKVISVPSSLRFYYKDAKFRYSGRYTMKIGCQMVFQYYPADTQRCIMEVKSYSYSATTLVLTWKDGKKPAIKKGLTLPNFALALGNPEEFWLNTSSSAYSGIRFAIVLRRHLGFHLIQTYLLSCLFVILSFLTFLVAHESVLECMALCMTTLLTLTAMFAAVKQNTPTVSYVKGLDIWMVTCIFSVFFTLVEHTVLLRLRTGSLFKDCNIKPTTKAKRRLSIFSVSGRRMRKSKKSQPQDPLAMYYHKCSNKCKCSDGGTSDNSPVLEVRRNTGDRTSSSTSALWRNDFLSSIPTLSPCITPMLTSPVHASTRATTSMSMFEMQNHYPNSHATSNGRIPNRTASFREANNYNTSNNYCNSNNSHATTGGTTEAKRKYLSFRKLKQSTRLELLFSKLIPFSFLVFNCIYWPWLLRSADYYNDEEFENTRYV